MNIWVADEHRGGSFAYECSGTYPEDKVEVKVSTNGIWYSPSNELPGQKRAFPYMTR